MNEYSVELIERAIQCAEHSDVVILANSESQADQVASVVQQLLIDRGLPERYRPEIRVWEVPREDDRLVFEATLRPRE